MLFSYHCLCWFTVKKVKKVKKVDLLLKRLISKGLLLFRLTTYYYYSTTTVDLLLCFTVKKVVNFVLKKVCNKVFCFKKGWQVVNNDDKLMIYYTYCWFTVKKVDKLLKVLKKMRNLTKLEYNRVGKVSISFQPYLPYGVFYCL